MPYNYHLCFLPRLEVGGVRDNPKSEGLSARKVTKFLTSMKFLTFFNNS